MHHGVDLEEPGARMTTLTQGLVKLLYYPNGFKQGVAKLRQSLIAKYALNSIITKDDQLLLFLARGTFHFSRQILLQLLQI